jgi:hypothetical protein
LKLAEQVETVRGNAADPGLASRLYQTAAQIYRSPCERGDGRACFSLGVLYSGGRPVERDLVLAQRLFGQGCDRGVAEACHRLAAVYDWGWDQPQVINRPRAAALYENACQMAHADSCARAGFMHLHGQGIRQDQQRGRELLQRAAELKKRR